MHINDIFARDAATFSFEFFPPKTEKGWDALFNHIQQLESLRPSFVSVTYGAGGSTRQQTHDLVTTWSCGSRTKRRSCPSRT